MSEQIFWEESLTNQSLHNTLKFFRILNTDLFRENIDFFLFHNKKWTVQQAYDILQIRKNHTGFKGRIERWEKAGIFSSEIKNYQRYYWPNKEMILQALEISNKIYLLHRQNKRKKTIISGSRKGNQRKSWQNHLTREEQEQGLILNPQVGTVVILKEEEKEEQLIYLLRFRYGRGGGNNTRQYTYHEVFSNGLINPEEQTTTGKFYKTDREYSVDITISK